MSDFNSPPLVSIRGRWLRAGALLDDFGYLPGQRRNLLKLVNQVRGQAEAYHVFPFRKLKLGQNALTGRFGELPDFPLRRQYIGRLSPISLSDGGNRLFEVADNGVSKFRGTVVP